MLKSSMEFPLWSNLEAQKMQLLQLYFVEPFRPICPAKISELQLSRYFSTHLCESLSVGVCKINEEGGKTIKKKLKETERGEFGR
jgi:hypothetical protein